MARPRTQPRAVDHPAVEDVTLQQVLDAVADPVRREVVFQLVHAEQDKSCGTFDIPVSLSTLTHHFNVLREAGVIRQYYAGTAKMNTLRTGELETRFPGLFPALVTAIDDERALTAP